MQTSTPTLPRAQFSATFPRHAPTRTEPATSKTSDLAERAMSFARAHWKEIGVAALGLLGWRSKRLRPLLRKAAVMYAIPAVKSAFARARR